MEDLIFNPMIESKIDDLDIGIRKLWFVVTNLGGELVES